MADNIIPGTEVPEDTTAPVMPDENKIAEVISQDTTIAEDVQANVTELGTSITTDTTPVDVAPFKPEQAAPLEERYPDQADPRRTAQFNYTDYSKEVTQGDITKQVLQKMLGTVASDEAVATMSEFEKQQAVDTIEKMSLASSPEEYQKKVEEQRTKDAEVYTAQLQRMDNEGITDTVLNIENDVTLTDAEKTLRMEQLAKRITEDYSPLEKLSLYYRMNRAQYETGGAGGLMTAVYQILDDPRGVLYGATIGQVERAASFVTGGTGMDDYTAEKLRRDAILERLRPYIMEQDGTAVSMLNEIITDPLTYTPWKFFKAATKAATFALNVGTGAAFTTFLQWLKDDDRELHDWIVGAGIGGTLNGALSMFLHVGPRVPNAKIPGAGTVDEATVKSVNDEVTDELTQILQSNDEELAQIIAKENPEVQVLDEVTPEEVMSEVGVPGRSLEDEAQLETNLMGNVGEEVAQVAPTPAELMDDASATLAIVDDLTPPPVNERATSVFNNIEHLTGNSPAGVERSLLDNLTDGMLNNVNTFLDNIRAFRPDVANVGLVINKAIHTAAKLDYMMQVASRGGYNFNNTAINNKLSQLLTRAPGTDIQASLTTMIREVVRNENWEAASIKSNPSRIFSGGRELGTQVLTDLMDYVGNNRIDRFNLDVLPRFLAGDSVKLSDLFATYSASNLGDMTIRMDADATSFLITKADGTLHTYDRATSGKFMYTMEDMFSDILRGRLDINLSRTDRVPQGWRQAETSTPQVPTSRNEAQRAVDLIAEGDVYAGLDKLVQSMSYFKSDGETRGLYEAIGKVFSVFKDSFAHKYPRVSAALERRDPGNIHPGDVIEDILTKYNRSVPEGKKVWVRVNDSGGRVTFHIFSQKQLPNARELYESGGLARSQPYMDFAYNRNGGKYNITSVGATGVGANGEGQLIYHAIQEFIALKKGTIYVCSTLFNNNKSARPLHLLSTVLNRPSLIHGINYQGAGMASSSALAHFTSHSGRAGKTIDGYVGSSIIDLIRQSRKQGIAQKPQIGPDGNPVPQTGNVPHVELPKSLMERFGFDSRASAFTVDGVVKTYDETSQLFERAVKDWMQESGYTANYAFKGFNSQIRAALIGKQLLKELVNGGPEAYTGIIRRFKSGIKKELDYANEVNAGTRTVEGGYRSKPRAFSKYIPATGLLIPLPIFADSLEQEANDSGNDSTWGVVAGTVAVILMAALGRKGYKAWSKHAEDIAENTRIYGNVKKETLEKLQQSLASMEEKLADDTLSAAAKGRIRALKRKTLKIQEMVVKYNSLEHLASSIKNRETLAYIESKARPVVQVAPENIAKIQERYLAGDFEGMADNFDFNLDRIDTTEEVEELMQTVTEVVRDQIDLTRRGTVSLESIMSSAKEFGFDIKDLNRLYGGTKELAEHFTAARMLLLRVGDDAAKVGRLIEEGTATEADKIEFTRLLGLYSSIHAMTKSSQTEIARALTSMRNTSRIHRGSSTDEITRILRGIEGRDGLDDVMNRWLIATEGERDLIARNVGNPGKYKKTIHVFNELFINGILGGLTTHMVNIFSNSITAFEGLARHLAIAESGMERFYIMKGFMQGIAEAGPAGWRALKRGQSYLDTMNKLEIPDAIAATYFNVNNPMGAAAIDTVGKMVRIPSRFLAAEDDFFKMISYRMKLSGEAYRAARQMGLEGHELTAKANDLMKDAAFWLEVKTQPQGSVDQDIVDVVMGFNREHGQLLESMYDTSINVAREQTFTNELGESGRALQNFLTKTPEARFIMPFVRTPINIMKFFGNRIPMINLIGNKSYRTAVMKKVTGQPMTRAETIALKEFYFNSMVGGALLTSSMFAARDGKITGMAPNKRDRTQVEAGWKPYSIKTWNAKTQQYEYKPYNRMDPLGMFMGVAADLSTIYDTTDRMTTKTNELYSAALMSFVNNFVDKTYLSGLMNVASAVSSESDTVMANFVNNTASSLIPKYIGTVRKAVDPYSREVFTLTDALKNQIPGLSDTLTPRRNYRGEAITGPSWWDPATPGIEKNDPVNMAIRETGVEFPKIPKNIHGTSIEYTPEQYDFLTKRTGEIFQENAYKLVTDTRKWNSLTNDSGGFDGSKKHILKQYMTAAKDQAEVELAKQFPDLFAQEQEFRKTKKKALTQNVGTIDTPQGAVDALQSAKPKGAVTIDDLKF